MQHLYRQIYADPRFHVLEKKRGRFSWTLTAIILAGYFSFILVIAFRPGLLAVPVVSDGIITWGIPVGLAVILLSFLLTGIYVYRANREFDRMVDDLIRDIKRENAG